MSTEERESAVLERIAAFRRRRPRLTDELLAPQFGRAYDTDDRQILEPLLWFACDYGPGDPLRWSPVAVSRKLSA